MLFLTAKHCEIIQFISALSPWAHRSAGHYSSVSTTTLLWLFFYNLMWFAFFTSGLSQKLPPLTMNYMHFCAQHAVFGWKQLRSVFFISMGSSREKADSGQARGIMNGFTRDVCSVMKYSHSEASSVDAERKWSIFSSNLPEGGWKEKKAKDDLADETVLKPE